jgi:hypothetical protein
VIAICLVRPGNASPDQVTLHVNSVSSFNVLSQSHVIGNILLRLAAERKSVETN